MSGFALQLQAFFDKTREEADRIVAGAITEFAERVEDRSPVDTGFFRANWRLGVDAPSVADTGGLSFPAEVVGHVYYFTNNAAYARRLEYGFTGTDSLGRSYNQPGRGFVGITVMEWPDILRRAANTTGAA